MNRLVLGFLLSLLPLPSQACESPKQSLHLVYPKETKLREPVTVEFFLEGDSLRAHFEVHSLPINAKENLEKGEYPYQRDVVELFIGATGIKGNHLPYYEFELSPLGQQFFVFVDAKRKFHDGDKSICKECVTKTKDGWMGDIKVPLAKLDWNKDPSQLIGNAFAVLGSKPNRSFWSLSLPLQIKPNFHEPEFFKELVPCSPAK